MRPEDRPDSYTKHFLGAACLLVKSFAGLLRLWPGPARSCPRPFQREKWPPRLLCLANSGPYLAASICAVGAPISPSVSPNPSPSPRLLPFPFSHVAQLQRAPRVIF